MKNSVRLSLLVVWAMFMSGCAGRSVQIDPGVEADQPVDVAPFGQVAKWDKDDKDYGAVWEDARDICRVAVTFAEGETLPSPRDLRLEYWQSKWPNNRIPRDQPSGSGGSGWLDIGDWYQGKWQTADAKLDVNGRVFTFTFNPVNAKEFPKLRSFPAEYRTTMKLRLVSAKPLRRIASFEAYTDSVWKPLDFEVQWGGGMPTKMAQDWSGGIEVFNGHAVALDAIGDDTSVYKRGAQLRWNSHAGRNPTTLPGVAAKVYYAQPKGCNSFDETVVTIRTRRRSFSFAASDLIKHGTIFIPDHGVLVRQKGNPTTYPAASVAWQKATSEPKTMDLYSRVLAEKEQTFTRAWNDAPAKKPHYIPLSFEGGRQHFRLDQDGNITINRNWLKRIKGKDSPRCKWEGDELSFKLGLPGDVQSRTLVDGCLPIAIGEWQKDGVSYRQTAYVAPLNGISGGRGVAADDPLVLFARIEMKQLVSGAQGKLRVSVAQQGKDEGLVLRGDGLILADGLSAGLPRLLVTSRPESQFNVRYLGDRIVYQTAFDAGKTQCAVEIAIPFITMNNAEIAALKQMDFAGCLEAVTKYWRQRVAAGTQIVTPEPMINDFYKADVSHLLINTERDVHGGERYMPKVGTFHYGVYSNESTMMVSDLDRRGYTPTARGSLESWLHYQGTVALPGDYTTADGEFYGAGGYEAGGYNQHHGWVLWCMGEHYWYTRDKQWLDRAAPGIVKACDWIIKQRQRTIELARTDKLRAIEKGLLPPGSLEDIGDWRCWLSNNVFSWWGMDNAARALAAAGHPEGRRLVAEADAYKRDLLAAFTEAMVRSPVVRLRDGSWIPKVPSEVHRRGRSFGWITETLEGSIHLIRCGAIDPDSPLATWIVKDFEDNLYLSEQFGYQLPPEEFEKRWFSHGGISQQANLLHNSIPYLLRDEPEHFLRAYFNAFAVSYFPDTRMMTEHALPNIGDWRGDHYKSSDESQSTYWLRMMFVEERGDELWLGAAIPRYWLEDGRKIGITSAQTYFGPMSMQLESNASAGKITMTIDPPTRNAPKLIRARFRHPQGLKMVRCEVNGKAHERFDAQKEWVELSECAGRTVVTAYYDRR